MWIFKALAERLKALFVADVATDFEAQLVARDADRKAVLLRQAQKYDDEGLKGVAEELRQQTESLGTQRPLASVLPAIEHLHATEKRLFLDDDKPAVVVLPPPAPASGVMPLPLVQQVVNKKKGR